ncbi:MAG: hypothetical protein R2941_04905 [Desulfobacterales bacterium]
MLIDTAGLHESDDPVEKIGMEKSRERIQNADLLLFMTDMEHSAVPRTMTSSG